MANRLSLPDDFALPDHDGQPISLSKVLTEAKGTVLLPLWWPLVTLLGELLEGAQ
mgnify:CR=1 FL=1